MLSPPKPHMSLHHLHRAFVAAVSKDHWINLRGPERRPWLRAEEDALRDLELMVEACDPTPSKKDETASMGTDAIESAFRDGLATALQTLDETEAARSGRANARGPVEGWAARSRRARVMARRAHVVASLRRR